jgi:Fur family ferric uptake transcriptional regulator
MANLLRELTIAEANDLLRSRKLRRTYTRVNILQCLSRQSSPVSHADVGRELASLGFDTSTIFRGLNDLVEAQLVARLDVGDRTWRFELSLAADVNSGAAIKHPHIICSRCGKVECVAAINVPTVDKAPRHWVIEEVVFKGICPTCAAQTI